MRTISHRANPWPIAVAIVLLAACGSSDDDTDATAQPAATEPAATEPAATEPAATEPTATEPTATEPAATEPAATEPAATEPAATEPAPTDGGPAAGSPVVPASEVDLAAVPPETGIVVVGDTALIFSVIGPGSRKCFAIRDQYLAVGRFVDASGEVMQTDGFNTGELNLGSADDGSPNLTAFDGINGNAWVAGPVELPDIDSTGSSVDALEIDGNMMTGSATFVDVFGGTPGTVSGEFAINCG